MLQNGIIYPFSVEDCCSWSDQRVYTFQYKKRKPTRQIEQEQNAIMSRHGKRIVPRSLERIESYDKDGKLQADTMQCYMSESYFKAYTLHNEVKKHLNGIISCQRYVLSMCEKAMDSQQFEEALLDMIDLPIAFCFDGDEYTPNRKIVLIFGDTATSRFFERHHSDGLFGGWRYNENNILCYNDLPIWEAMKEEK